MAKVIAMFDEPKKCAEGSCPCNYDGVGCTLDDLADHKMTEDGSIPKWCPLIPEPERMSEKNGFFPLPEDMQMQAIGWNACLDAIEGEEEQ